MTDAEFESALVSAAFTLGAEEGWRRVSAAAAARHGNLDLALARRKFPCRGAILAAFGRLADAHALEGATQEGMVKDRLFDILMRRFDYLQSHRAGVRALLRALPGEPPLAAWLGCATLASMGWMLEGAGVSARGIRGEIRKRGLLAVWTYTLRAWARDDSADLGPTMAALDHALTRADGLAARFAPARHKSHAGEAETDAEPETHPEAGSGPDPDQMPDPATDI